MTPEAQTIVASAYTLIRANCASMELVDAVERLTELGLDPLNTRVKTQADALLEVRHETLRCAAALMNAPRPGDSSSPTHGESGAASPAGHGTQGDPAAGRPPFRPDETPSGTVLSVIEGGLGSA